MKQFILDTLLPYMIEYFKILEEEIQIKLPELYEAREKLLQDR